MANDNEKESSNWLQVLCDEIVDVDRRDPIPYTTFLDLVREKPEFVFRDIFQLFYDMIQHYVPEGIEEYPDHSETIGYLNYDSTKLFIDDCDNPFFADRLFMNRLMNLVENFRTGSLNNHIFIFEGPPGSGKSTFLNNFLQKLEDYVHMPEGTIFKTYWRLDIEKLGGFIENDAHMNKAHILYSDSQENLNQKKEIKQEVKKKYLQFSCPRHDHPILQIPKKIRAQFLEKLIPDEEFKKRLFCGNEFEWVLKDNACSICQSLFSTLIDELGDPKEVYKMIYARKMHFNRQFGEGISVYNPGDDVFQHPIRNKHLESLIHGLLKNDNVQFVYSDLAKTNNGVLALMDIKENNIERLLDLHGIISDGVHKVDITEERIKSLFVGLVNPEDKSHYENIKSFQDRIINVNISYILDYTTEVDIYKNKFGREIEKYFLPQVLDNFAKIIISTRMNTDTTAIKKWIGEPDKYSQYLDKNLLLLKMDIYTGKIPSYLTEDDLKKFDRITRKEILTQSEEEGKKGISGRQSINIFSQFLAKFADDDKPITMEQVNKYFVNNEKLFKEIPAGFLKSLTDMYDYYVLQEVKESIYYYNDNQIIRDIKNYLFAINYDIGDVKQSKETGDTIEIDEEYFKDIEVIFLGGIASENQRKEFRKNVQNEYITKTVAQDIRINNMKLEDSDQFKSLFEKYIRNLKEYALSPYENSDNLKRAILAYETESLNTYDERLKRSVTQLITNLQKKFKYSLEGAREVSLYVLDKALNKKYTL
jgi:predicted Ser/Thr protein kinase